MAAKSSPSDSVDRSEPPNDSSMTQTEENTVTVKEVLLIIDSLKKQVTADRSVYVKKRLEENRQNLGGITSHLYKLSNERRSSWISDTDSASDLLTKRQKDALSMQNGFDISDGDKDSYSYQEPSTAVLMGSSIPVKNAVRPVKLTEVKKLPPYTTWIFLDRNQRMTEDQSVVGRRRIYYDQNGGEALICSDSEEEAIEEDEEKRDFAESEDFILRMTIKEVGLSDPVLESLAQCLYRSPSEVKARYETLMKEGKDAGASKNGDIEAQNWNSFLEKDLEAALDSFDNLFCRRCLVFDCRLHGCSQDLIFPADKQTPWNHPDEENEPCGPHCYRLVLNSERNGTVSTPMNPKEKSNSSSDGVGAQTSSRKKSSGPYARRKVKSCQSESALSNAKNLSESSDSEIGPRHENSLSPIPQLSPSKNKIAGKSGILKRNSKRVAERVLICMRKRQKKMAASYSDSVVSGGVSPTDMKLRSNAWKENEDSTSSSQKNVKSPNTGRSRRKEWPLQEGEKGEVPEVPSSETINELARSSSNYGLRKEEFVDENLCKQELSDDKSWKAIEKGLFEKGVEIFGTNSCLIARNLLNGLKTCWEVFQYMTCSDNKLACHAADGVISLLEGYSKFDLNGTMGNNEVRRRSRFLRRRGRVRRLKYTWKSAAYHSIRKRITERKDQPCRQYNPCSCQTACGKQCACLLNGTCCEKYCGCPKSCKNRFRGCHCAKSQCRSRQCPCFAADRECDPDVCRNCWVSCGDGTGTLGAPPQRGDNYECRNMKLLLKQQQRVLLGRSDVSGWGAFLKNSVGKHEYLGEYTGELISHREADKRGKIYDRENSSFLFNLNDQFVLDAYRKGDKLKFANHSPDPNCYAKVIMVAGDHRVGIFAKERINAGEELFYDYRYEPDRAPAWARKPEASGSKKEDGAPSSGRAKKLA
ncbi:histone-lysine N-methyltransferase CLF-like isoform X2 [Durio zibethinus]|uniref:[histone H3]-lysine(27) N-trimethyltransferase n=1 Tax=Durio zibethinus TaxID=66656 RepID=A0A6P5YFP6_DURZI|nr:histone-lysine N-methyltransferase CLF-like isoform X2 [Durio zibethinus]